ncbi:unnamed protein product [Nyctereutes procyonoides]|uniref:(raccoon dog) hypothetical protein n=1 Tax=Nyctereutes procyonoides TaxID=34880 RepID=A0A811ZHZ3_NYCPR|nr:unnamed protein product [Nyctereutes procyonoides]
MCKCRWNSKLKSIIIGKSKLPKSVKEDTRALPVIYKPSKDAFQLNVLGFHEEDVRAMLLLDSSLVHSSTKSLSSEDVRIKCMFFLRNTSTLIQPMHQGVILSCKRLYRWKQLEESLAIFEESDDEQDKGEKGVSKIKIYNIKSAVFNWAKTNAWENLYKKEPDYDLQGLEDGDYREILEKCGELETHWLRIGGITKEVIQKGGGDEEQTAEFQLSAVRERLDHLLDFVDATPEFQRFHFTLKEMQQEIKNKTKQKTKQTVPE